MTWLRPIFGLLLVAAMAASPCLAAPGWLSRLHLLNGDDALLDPAQATPPQAILPGGRAGSQTGPGLARMALPVTLGLAGPAGQAALTRGLALSWDEPSSTALPQSLVGLYCLLTI